MDCKVAGKASHKEREYCRHLQLANRVSFRPNHEAGHVFSSTRKVGSAFFTTYVYCDTSPSLMQGSHGHWKTWKNHRILKFGQNHGILFPKPAKVLNGHFIDCDFINGTPEGDLRTCPLSLELNLVHSLFHSYS